MEIREFYEKFPYPARDEHSINYQNILPSDFNVINHYVFQGKWPKDRTFRVLVAGGGTGDAVVSLGRQLTELGQPFSIRYLDLSQASLEIAKSRCTNAGLTEHIEFECGPLETLAREHPDTFDYIDFCGVINHVEEPSVAIASLRNVLTADGGIGVMAYGDLGRTGVYPIQYLLRKLGLNCPSKISEARKFLEALPEENWIRKNINFKNIMHANDIEFADALFNPRDRAFSTKDLSDLLAEQSMRIQAFLPPVLYDPASSLARTGLSDRVAGLTNEEKWEVAEALQGTLHKHTFYAVNSDHLPPPDLREIDPDWIARFRGGATEIFSGPWPENHDGRISIRFQYESQTRSLGTTISATERALIGAMLKGACFGEILEARPKAEQSDARESLARLCQMFSMIGIMSIECASR